MHAFPHQIKGLTGRVEAKVQNITSPGSLVWRGLPALNATHSSRPPPRSAVVEEMLLGVINTQVLQLGDKVVSHYHRRIQHGSLSRVLDKTLNPCSVGARAGSEVHDGSDPP